MHVTVLRFDVLRVRLVHPPPCVSVVSLSVSPDDGSGSDEVPCGGDWTILNIGNFLFGVVCGSVELAVVCCCRVFPSRFSQFKIWFFYCWFFPLGEVGLLPLIIAVCLAPAHFCFHHCPIIISCSVVAP